MSLETGFKEIPAPEPARSLADNMKDGDCLPSAAVRNKAMGLNYPDDAAEGANKPKKGNTSCGSE